MNLRHLTIAFVLVLSVASYARDQIPSHAASELINSVAANELTARMGQRKWMYVIEKRDGKHALTEKQVDLEA